MGTSSWVMTGIMQLGSVACVYFYCVHSFDVHSPTPTHTHKKQNKGTEKGMQETFGSTCHGAGRAISRSSCRQKLEYSQVLTNLKTKGIAIRVASPKLVSEEAPESYKDVNDVVDICHNAGISKKTVRLRPIAVIKG